MYACSYSTDKDRLNRLNVIYMFSAFLPSYLVIQSFKTISFVSYFFPVSVDFFS